MSGTGTVTIDFGAFPGSNEASVNFTDAAVLVGSKVDAFVMSDATTSDHTASDHKYAELFFSLSGQPDAGVGGTIYARSIHKMQGTFSVRWVWV